MNDPRVAPASKAFMDYVKSNAIPEPQYFPMSGISYALNPAVELCMDIALRAADLRDPVRHPDDERIDRMAFAIANARKRGIDEWWEWQQMPETFKDLYREEARAAHSALMEGA